MKAIFKNYGSVNSKDPIDKLMSLSFAGRIKTIQKMDVATKAEYAAMIEEKLQYMYASTKDYYDSMFGSPMSPDMFLHVMNKIKQLETVSYWIYEVDILMGETEIDRLIAEAEKRIEEQGTDDFNRIRVKTIRNEETGKEEKKRVVVKASEDLATLQREKRAHEAHTDEIADLAKELMKKHFNDKMKGFKSKVIS